MVWAIDTSRWQVGQRVFGIVARLRHIVSTLPERAVQGVQLYGRLHEVIARLPQALMAKDVALGAGWP